MNYKDKLYFKISLKRGTITGANFYKKIFPKLWFKPVEIYLSGVTKGSVKFRERYLKKINNNKTDFSIVLSNDNNDITITEPALFETHQSESIEFDISACGQVMAFVKEMFFNDNLMAAYLCSYYYYFTQTTEEVSHYEVFKIDIPSNFKIIKDELNWDVIDTSQNPGRFDLIPDMWLSSCGKMWFGKAFFETKNIDVNEFVSFDNAKKIKILNNGIVYIELFSNPFEAYEEINMNKQQKFRDFIETLLNKNSK